MRKAFRLLIFSFAVTNHVTMQIRLSPDELKQIAEDLAPRLAELLPAGNPAHQAPPQLLTPTQFQEYFGVTPKTEIKLRRTNQVPYLLCGNQIRYELHKCIEAMERRAVKETARRMKSEGGVFNGIR